MIVRQAQIDTLAHAVACSFATRVEKYLRRELPDVCAAAGDERLRQWTREGVAEATACGITIEWDVCRYVEYKVRFGGDIRGRPQGAWTEPILADDTLDGTAKMDRIDYQFLYEPGSNG